MGRLPERVPILGGVALIDQQPPGTGFFYSVKYIHDNFGPSGTDEVWVAPTERVYSYLVVRDLGPLAGLENLKRLELNGSTALSEAEVAKLQQALPKAGITH